MNLRKRKPTAPKRMRTSDEIRAAEQHNLNECKFLQLPELVHNLIADHLLDDVESLSSLRSTGKFMRAITPVVTCEGVRIKHGDFSIRGPSSGHWCPEKWFDSPPLLQPVSWLTMSMKWVDQGFGNKKGQLFLQLVRDNQMVAECRDTFGTCGHRLERAECTLSDSNLLKASQKGDVLRFMRNAGGGGGHSLKVHDFNCTVFYHPKTSTAREAEEASLQNAQKKTRAEPDDESDEESDEETEDSDEESPRKARVKATREVDAASEEYKHLGHPVVLKPCTLETVFKYPAVEMSAWQVFTVRKPAFQY